jgi:hypothetical protein
MATTKKIEVRIPSARKITTFRSITAAKDSARKSAKALQTSVDVWVDGQEVWSVNESGVEMDLTLDMEGGW